MYSILLILTLLVLSVLCIRMIIRYKTEKRSQSKLLLKYKDLLKPILAEKKINCKANNLSQLIIHYREAKTLTTFALYEIENKLFVTWAHNRSNRDKRGKEWCFQQDSDQQKMYQQIKNDIESYLKLVRN